MAELILGVAGLLVGVPGLLQVIGSLADTVLQRVKHYDEDYQRRLELVITINKSQMQEIFLFLDNGQAVPVALNDEVVRMFQILRNIFERLLNIFPSVGLGNQISQRMKISASMKVKLDSEIRELEEWSSRIFIRTLVFVMFGGQKVPNTIPTDSEDGYEAAALRKVERLRDAVDQSLGRIKQAPQLLLCRPDEPDDRHPLSNSSLELSTPKDTDKKAFIVEYRTYNDDAREQEINYQRQIVREVARILHQADPRFMGLLQSDGFLCDPLKNRFELHFPFPPGSRNPRTLLDLLCDPGNRRLGVRHPLNQRIGLAKSIVTALFVLHAANFVHKQIRPDNVLVFDREHASLDSSVNSGAREATSDKQTYPYVLGGPFLVGFDNVRKVDAASLMMPVEDWKRNIYLCPERQRLQPGDEFRMQHDIYSLGVVLLEIAFWASFQDRKSPQLGRRIWKDESQSILCGPEELKKIYLALATGAVPRLMGQKYADAVLACLTGLESEVGDKRNYEDSDGIIVGTKYVMEVVKKLEEISM